VSRYFSSYLAIYLASFPFYATSLTRLPSAAPFEKSLFPENPGLNLVYFSFSESLLHERENRLSRETSQHPLAFFFLFFRPGSRILSLGN
jgi:hypothetical protein